MQLDFNKLVNVAFLEESKFLKDGQIETINQLIKYQDYYDNNVFKYIVENNPEYGQYISKNKSYKPAQIPLNYCRYIINKLASWQFEIPVDFNCTSKKAEARADEIEKDIYKIHKKNLMDSKLLQGATECNISGGVVFKLKYDIDKKDIRIFVRNRIECFPVYDFDDYEKIIKVHFVTFTNENTIWKQTYELKNGICYIEENLYDTKQTETPNKTIIEYQPLGINGKCLDFIPAYIVPNLPQIGEVFGPSETKDLIPIINEINKKYSDLSDSLRFDMFAITILLNTNPTSKNPDENLKTKPGAIWAMVGGGIDGPNPDIFKLESKFQYSEPLQFLIDNLVAAIFQFSECLKLSVDKITGQTNLSGVALKLLFAAILSKTTRKNTIWKSKLREMYMGILKMKQVYEGYNIPDDLDIEIITHIPIPENELEEIEIITKKIADGLISITKAMNEIGIENPEAEIAKILEERLAYDKKLNLSF